MTEVTIENFTDREFDSFDSDWEDIVAEWVLSDKSISTQSMSEISISTQSMSETTAPSVP